MKGEALLALLQKEFAIQTDTTPWQEEINRLCLYNEKETEWRTGTLYAVPPGESIPSPMQPAQLLCTKKPPAMTEGSAWLLCKEADFSGVYNRIQAIIEEHTVRYDEYFRLTRLASSGIRIHPLINQAADVLDNALILVNAYDRVIASSSNYSIEDPLWEENIRRGYCTGEFIQSVKTSANMKEWSEIGSDSHIIRLPGDRQDKLVARTIINGHLSGGLIMIAHHSPITEKSTRLLPLIGQLLMEVYYKNNTNSHSSPSAHTALLYDLLDEQNPFGYDSYLVRQLSFPASMQVIVARYIDRIDNRYLKRKFLQQMESVFPAAYSVQYKSYFALLAESIREEQYEQLQALAESEKVRIGISWKFEDLRQFRRYFYQAVAAIKQAQRFHEQRLVHDYSEYACYDLYYHYEGNLPLKNFIHPALLFLRAYDAENDTELYTTLRHFLETDKNHYQTAERLFIHRNTLRYRIARIEELTGLDLNAPSVPFALLQSYRLADYLES